MLSFLLLALFVSRILALPTISAKGSKFFTSDGAQFYVKGVAYQLTTNDPLANPQQCKLDAALMKSLGANSIRVYHVNPNADHDGCMSTFADAGIYAWIDLDTFDTYIIPDYGSPTPQWNETQFHAYQKVMDAFHKYDNTAGFFVGNEMLNTGESSNAAPYVKAAARDMKVYRDNQGYRPIPVGYSAADVAALRPNLQNYLACGSNSANAVDFYSLNAYEWCGDSTYEESGYSMLEQNATDYDIPIFFSETGCNVPEPRTFADQSAIFGPRMRDTWSGAIIYEWVEEANNYGLVSYADSGTQGTPTPISPDFSNLLSQWKTLNPTGVSEKAYSPSLTPPPCPAYTSGFWDVHGNVPLPTLVGAASTTPVTPGSSSSTTSSSSAAAATRSVSQGLRTEDWTNPKALLRRAKAQSAAMWLLYGAMFMVAAAFFS